MSMDTRLVDELLKGCTTVESIAGANGLLKQWTKALERALAAELTTHLGYEKHALEGRDRSNSRNGTSSKRLEGGLRDAGDCGSARPPGELRAAAGDQASDALARL